jgi:hypothetical protein
MCNWRIISHGDMRAPQPPFTVKSPAGANVIQA